MQYLAVGVKESAQLFHMFTCVHKSLRRMLHAMWTGKVAGHGIEESTQPFCPCVYKCLGRMLHAIWTGWVAGDGMYS